MEEKRKRRKRCCREEAEGEEKRERKRRGVDHSLTAFMVVKRGCLLDDAQKEKQEMLEMYEATSVLEKGGGKVRRYQFDVSTSPELLTKAAGRGPAFMRRVG